MNIRTIVELDLVGYSTLARELEENFDAEIVDRLNEQIQGFVDYGLGTVNADRKKVVLATTGDGAIVAFDRADDAHRFAIAFLSAAQTHNANVSVISAQRWFRIGIATGDLYEKQTYESKRIAGIVIANAVRLEAAAHPGEIVADIGTYTSLSPDLQTRYGPEELVHGKRDERFTVRRYSVIPYYGNDDPSTTVVSILQLFDQLNPRDQLDAIMTITRMPEMARPSKSLRPFERQFQLIDWVVAEGMPKMVELRDALKFLIKRQKPPL